MKYLSLVCMSSTLAFVAASGASAQEAGFAPPKTSWGAPEITGTWSNTSLTTLARPREAKKLGLTREEAEDLLKTNIYAKVAADEAERSNLDDASSNKLLGDENPNRGYNHFWMDAGQFYAKVKGEYRSSWIVDPPSGQIPWKAKPPKNRYASQDYDGPEVRSLAERCITYNKVGPVLGNGMYNNTIELVQTPDHLMLEAEMMHEARIIPIFKDAAEARNKHGNPAIPKWGGDSVAWYEGNSLVVETVNPWPEDERSYISAAGKATERFTRWSKDEVLYEFRVEDSKLYTQPWSGEMILRTADKPMYEYACHEGNYALRDILAGARTLEAEGRKDPKIQATFGDLEEDSN